MKLIDLLIAPLFIAIIFAILRQYASRNIKDGLLRRYFILGFGLKVFGAVSMGLIYQYYYGGGDTFNYYQNASVVRDAFINSPATGLSIVFAKAGDYSVDQGQFTSFLYFYTDAGSFFVVRVAALFSLISLNSFMAISILFTLISFTGVWTIYLVFVREYPYLKKSLAIACLFLPSLVFWGSGLMKDPLCMGAVGWLIYGVHSLVVRKGGMARNISLVLVGGYLLLSVKIYILMCMLPAILVWLSIRYGTKSSSPLFRIALVPAILAVTGVAGYFATKGLAADNEKYSFDNLVETSAVTAHYLHRISDEASSYSLSTVFDGSAGSVLRLAPEAIFVSLFRPGLWEAKNPLMLISALENAFLLFLFFRGIAFSIQGSPKSPIPNNKLLIFCAVFSVFFSIAIGMTTYNFGALVRYKIPMLPFFVGALIVVNYKAAAVRRLRSRLRKIQLARKLV